MSKQEKEVIHTKIWNEVPEEDNPFAAAKCFCCGYDVYGELLGKISWAEYIFLLFSQQRPSQSESKLLEAISVAIANPGIRDHSVRAAMNAGVGGSTSASALMAALAVGAGQLGGAREIYLLLNLWSECGTNLSEWKKSINNPPKPKLPDSWPEPKHPIGFEPSSISLSMPIRQTLKKLKTYSNGTSLSWLDGNRKILESTAGCPLSMTSVIGAAFYDLGFTPDQGEMLYLFLRLPGAAVHALEQKSKGWRMYPFFKDGLKIMDDPGSITT